MLSLFQSASLQALGYAITNSIWQMAILWLLYLLFGGMTKGSARKKYNLAVLLQVAGFVWFLFTFQFYHGQYAQLLALHDEVQPANAIPTVIPTGNNFKSLLIRFMIWAEKLLPYFSIAYLLLMVVLLVRWYMSYRQVKLLRTEGLMPVPDEWTLFMEELSTRMQIGRKVSIYLSEKVVSPLTIGFLKPLILIPVASINHLSIAQLEAIILHELAHIKRLDYLVNIFLSITEIGLFFNPFTQMLAKQIRKEREHCCDDWVLAYSYNPATYAEALLRIAQLQPNQALSLSATGNSQHELLGRVKRMIGIQERSFNYRKQLLAFFLVTGILSSIAWLGPKEAPQAPATLQAGTAIQPIAVEPMAVKITNPLFNPAFFLSGTLKKEMQENLEMAAKEIQETFNSNEVKATLQQIPQTVMQALSEANIELAKDQHKMQAELSEIDMARAEMAQAYKVFDSLPMGFLPGSLRIRDEVTRSLQHLDVGLNQVIGQTLNSLKQVPMAIPDLKDLKIEQSIGTALDEINKAGLDKLIPAIEWDKIMKDVNEAIKQEKQGEKTKNKKRSEQKKEEKEILIEETEKKIRTSKEKIVVLNDRIDSLSSAIDPLFNKMQFALLDEGIPFLNELLLEKILFRLSAKQRPKDLPPIEKDSSHLIRLQR